MKRFTLIGWLLFFAASIDAAEFRVATFNMQEVGTEGTTQYDALLAVIDRMCPEVIVVQEINDYPDRANFQALASGSGYLYSTISDISGTLSGTMWTGCLSMLPIETATSWSAAEISGDNQANDICRDIFEVRLSLPNTAIVGIITVHLKAYSGSTDKFRRQVEIMRLSSVIDFYRTSYPDEYLIVAGDFNEDYENSPFGSPTWTTVPSDVPASYHLGSDIQLPITYDPFVPLFARGLSMADATWEDTTDTYATYPSYSSRIDYVFHSANLYVLGDEVYYSSRDDGEDDPPPGNWLEKCGNPLAFGTSRDASDHLPVMVDFEYSSTQPTETPPSTPSRTPTPASPTQTPTPAPATPTPTPEPSWFGVRLEMPDTYFRPGSPCWLTAIIGNNQVQPQFDCPLVIMLDIGADVYWFWPSWSQWPEELDYRTITLKVGETTMSILEPFTWPSGIGSASGFSFWGAILDRNLTYIRGELGFWEFGYGE